MNSNRDEILIFLRSDRDQAWRDYWWARDNDPRNEDKAWSAYLAAQREISDFLMAWRLELESRRNR